MTEEWVDILDKEGNYTGKSCPKNEAHKKGLFHPTVHVWFYTDKNELLFQLRSPNKINYPNLLDVSVAGHVKAGETPIKAAIRETKEELGLTIYQNDLEPIGIHKSMVTHRNDYIDNEFNHIFLCLLKQDINSLVLQQEEVVSIKLFPIEQLKNLTHEFVLYSDTYLQIIFNYFKS